MKQDRMEKLIKKNVILFTKNKHRDGYDQLFRSQGIVHGYDGKFLEIFDETKKKIKLISVNEIVELEIQNENKNHQM